MSEGRCPSCDVPTKHRCITGHLCDECIQTYSMEHNYITEWNALSGASHTLKRIILVQYLLPFTTQMMDAQALFSEAPFPTSQVVVQDLIENAHDLMGDLGLAVGLIPVDACRDHADLIRRIGAKSIAVAQAMVAIDHSFHRGILDHPELIWPPDSIREELRNITHRHRNHRL